MEKEQACGLNGTNIAGFLPIYFLHLFKQLLFSSGVCLSFCQAFLNPVKRDYIK